MKYIPATKFRNQCLAVIKKVQSTREPVIVTNRGVPLVKTVALPPKKKDDIFGFMKGKARIVGDIESPIPVEWGTITE